MTKREKQIVSAYTGVLMCDFSDVHAYIEEILERPVFTHELSGENLQHEIKEKSKAAFLEICAKDDGPEQRVWWEIKV